MRVKQEFRIILRLVTEYERPISEAKARRIADALVNYNREKEDNLVEVRITEVLDLTGEKK